MSRDDYFITDEESPEDDLLSGPVIVPPRETVPPPTAPPRELDTRAPRAAPPSGSRPAPAQPAPRPAPRATDAVPRSSREERLAEALDSLIANAPDVQAVSLVSLDGFTMASALPPDMQEDRVGAMSAAILGLGERAAAELGRGTLSQVYIEGEDGYVVLMSAGGRAVLTALADADAKLGLIMYDMRSTAARIGEILG